MISIPILGNKCIGAKINFRLVPINHTLENGDQIEILTSEKQIPKMEWLKFATTAKRDQKLKMPLSWKRKNTSIKAREIVEEAMKAAKGANNFK
jgi:GTP diphosphokinase / guanosine-3',5'-bis(diphosphate) 3'-diphosphatase